MVDLGQSHWIARKRNPIWLSVRYMGRRAARGRAVAAAELEPSEDVEQVEGEPSEEPDLSTADLHLLLASRFLHDELLASMFLHDERRDARTDARDSYYWSTRTFALDRAQIAEGCEPETRPAK